MELKRYGFDHVSIGVCDDAEFIERFDGEYVRYDDIKHLLNIEHQRYDKIAADIESEADLANERKEHASAVEMLKWSRQLRALQ